MDTSRTKNSIKNAKSGLIVQLMNKILAFVVRTVFISTLNVQYLGINGLFTNILTLISFAELGIGTAITFNMYKPIVDKDLEKIKSLMKLYQTTYNIIGIVILAIGLAIIPILPYFTKDVTYVKENINLIYMLFLINTAISYFFTYKKSIISAYQQERIINYITGLAKLLASALQIIFLLITHNYISYLIITILETLFGNIIISHKATKMFPFLKDKNVKKLDKIEKKSIFNNVKSLIAYRFGEISLYGTDNIILSIMIDISSVGLVSNYTLIINSLKKIISTTLNSITASVGNLNAGTDIEKEEKIFKQLTFISYLLYSFAAIGLIILLNDFINLWLGPEYLLSFSICVVLVINLFIEGIRIPAYMYRITLGLFNNAKIISYITIIVNIFSSIILCHFFGIIGVFIGTIIAQLTSYSWIDVYLIYKYEFKKSIMSYYIKTLVYFIAFFVNAFISYKLITLLDINNLFLDFVIKFILACIIPNCINLLFFFKTEEFNDTKNKLLKRKLYGF